jgi:hypothetical protein
MLIQLLGRHEVGDRYGTVTLPSRVLPEGFLELTLVNFFICNENDHRNHFDPPQREAFPAQELYEEFIEIRVPRQIPIDGNRRRTVQFQNVIAPPQLVESDDGDDNNQRLKRSITSPQKEPILKRVKRNVNGFEISVAVSFNKTEVLCVENVTGLNVKTITFFINLFNTNLAKKRRIYLQNLFKLNFSLASVPLPTDPKSGYVVLNIPPRTKIGFVGRIGTDYFSALGFVFTNVTEVDEPIKSNDGSERIFKITYIVNESFTDFLTVKGKHVIKFGSPLETSFLLVQQASEPKATKKTSLLSPNQVAIKFELLDQQMEFSCNLTEESIANHNRRFTIAFFQNILETIENLLQFTPNQFNVVPSNDGKRIVFRKVNTPEREESNKFGISFDIGGQLATRLGFILEENQTEYSFDWKPLAGLKNEVITELLHDDDSDNPITNADLQIYLTNMKNDLINLNGPFPPLQALRDRYTQLLITKQQAKETRLWEAEQIRITNENRAARLKAEQEQQRQEQEQQEPEERQEQRQQEQEQQQPEQRQEQEHRVEIVPEIVEERRENQPEEEVEEVQINVEADQPDVPVQPVGQNIDVNNDEANAEPDLPPVVIEPFEILRIPNPIPRRAQTFALLKNEPTIRINPIPAGFPTEFSIILREGEPLDYIADRGFVSVLGIVRAASPRIISNKCLIKNTNQRISQLRVEFLDSHLNSWKPPGALDAYFKLDFVCRQIKY